MANDKDFILKNAIEVGGSTKVTIGDAPASGSVTVGYDISAASYDSVSFSVAGQDTFPAGLAFNNDGTKMYMVGTSSDSVYQYTLSTAFDLSTASYDSVSFSVTGQDGTPRGIAFNNDGTKMYIVGYNSDSVYQYTLSTAFDLSTASYDSVSFSVSSQDTQSYDIAFNNDGTKMYIIAAGNDSVYQYTLSTAFDLSTASYDSVSFSVSSQDTIPSDIRFNSDGTKMYVSGFSSDSVHQYSLSSAFDLSTASYDSVSFSVAGQDTNPFDITFNNDGTKMYITGSGNDSIYQYSTGSTVATATFDTSTGNYFTHTPSADSEYGFSNAGDVQTFQLEVTGAQSVVGYDLANAAYDSVASSPLIGNNTANNALFIAPDGYNLYVASGQNIQQHTMTTAWDLSTLPATASSTFSVSSQESEPTAIFFKPDGTKMYVLGNTNDTVYQYSLGTAWAVSTASYDSKSFVQYDVSAPRGCWFKTDGTKLFVVGPVSDRLFSYDVSTAWDVSTVSIASKVEVIIGSYAAAVNSFAMSGDGTKIFMGSNATPSDTVVQLELTTAWDLSTLTSNNVSFSYTSQEDQIGGLYFKDDGTKLYLAGQITSKSIYQYSTATSTAITITWDADIEWGGGTAPSSPASGQKDLYTITTDDGGTTYFGVPSGVAFS